MGDLVVNVNTTESDCPICLDPIEQTSEKYSITDCQHEYCNECLQDLINQNIIICPVCRREIKKYKNQNDTYHIIKVDTRTNVNDIELMRMRHKNFFYRSLLFLVLLGTFDIYYDNLIVKNDMNHLNILYQNCTMELENSNSLIRNFMNTKLININVFYDHILKMCSFPQYFVNMCINEPL